MKSKFSSVWRVAIALVLVVSFSLVMAVPASAVGTLAGVTATLGTTITGATTDYTIGFTTATDPCTIKSVDMAFDAAFDVSGATLGQVTGGATPGQDFDVGTLSIDGQTVTYTVTEPETFSGAKVVTIQLNGIVNPAAGTYVSAITIMTKTDTPAIIDTGSASVIIAPVPESFSVTTSGGGTEVAGTPFSVTVTALKADGVTTETGYAGDHLISFTSTATEPKIIPDFEMLTFANGTIDTSTSFVLNVVETGETITATDAALGITGPSSAITVTVGSLYGLVITGAPTAAVTAGVPFSADITVTSEDAYGNVLTTGPEATATITWSDGGTDAVLPAAHALVLGTWTFTGSGFTLKQSGVQTLIATESVGSDTSEASITVSPAAASKLSATRAPTSIEANGYTSSTITALVKDAYDNTVTTSTATITFETSLGQFANGDSTYSVAFAYHGFPDYTYYAKATLTSTDVGTATVKVTSGSLTYATALVILTDPAAPTEVWVDLTYVDTDHDGGHNFGTDAFTTIAAGIAAVATGGTVNVLAGEYAGIGTVEITKPMTLISDTGNYVTTGTIITGASSFYLRADDITIKGFKFQNTGRQVIITTPAGGGDGITISYNSFTDSTGGELLSLGGEPGDDWVITRNYFDGIGGVGATSVMGTAMYVCGSSIDDWEISYNTIKNCDFAAIELADGAYTNAIITQNTIDTTGGPGIQVGWWGAFMPSDITITYNTITNANTEGNEVDFGGSSGYKEQPKGAITLFAGVTDITIENNTLTGNDDGITVCQFVSASEVIAPSVHVNSNNISGNGYGVLIGTSIDGTLDAENNWWGDETGPYNSATNSAATGDAVSDNVDYRPWLTSAYSAEEVTTVSLSTGWNLISLPLYIPPANQAPVDLLVGVTGVVSVWGNYDPSDNSWDTYVPGQGENDLIAMRDGRGYWVNMTAADTLDVSTLGTELPAAPAAPPTYDVVVGWNLIGFKSTTAKTASTYLAALGTNYTMIYGFANGVYSVVQSTDSLEPGYGYWIAVTAVGTIYP